MINILLINNTLLSGKPAATCLAITVVFLSGFALKCLLKRKPSNHCKLPPSPIKFPIIGNLHQLGVLPHRTLDQLAKRHGSLMLLRLGSKPTLIVSSPSAAQEMFKTHDTCFLNRPDLERILSPTRVITFRSVREEETLLMVRKIEGSLNNNPFDLSELLSLLPVGLISRVAFGRKYSDSMRVKKLAEEFMAVLGAFEVEDYNPWLGWLNNFTGRSNEVAQTEIRGIVASRHCCAEACNITNIPSKTRVMVNAWAIGRDPRSWDNPETFDPERFLRGDDASDRDFRGLGFKFIPFSAGRRNCPGISYSVPVIDLALGGLLHRFDGSLPGGMKLEDRLGCSALSLSYNASSNDPFGYVKHRNNVRLFHSNLHSNSGNKSFVLPNFLPSTQASNKLNSDLIPQGWSIVAFYGEADNNNAQQGSSNSSCYGECALHEGLKMIYYGTKTGAIWKTELCDVVCSAREFSILSQTLSFGSQKNFISSSSVPVVSSSSLRYSLVICTQIKKYNHKVLFSLSL
uniref:Cytochrome P450 n=1 Tax=Kalanchoe fedtschenkoi TaxID=63787 RepID=A0A7N0VLR3_KALFE